MKVSAIVYVGAMQAIMDTAFVVGRLVVVLFPIALALISPAAIIQADYVREQQTILRKILFAIVVRSAVMVFAGQTRRNPIAAVVF